MRDVSRRPPTLAFVLSSPVLAVLAGCASQRCAAIWSAAERQVSLFPAPRTVSLELAAASADEPPDESVRLLRQEPLAERGSRPRSKLRPGLRAGMLVPGGTKDDRDWKSAASAGFLLRQAPSSPRATALELGADFAETETEDGARSSQLLFLRAELLAGRFAPSGVAPYFLAGAQAVLEQSTNNATGETASGRGGAVEIGLGYGAKNGRWDVRAAYAILVASENAEGGLTVSVALGF